LSFQIYCDNITGWSQFLTLKRWFSLYFRRVKLSVMSVALFSLLFCSQMAQAELYGLLHGRSADVNRMPSLSLDTGVVFGDDYQIIAVRANYKLTPVFLVYADVGFAEAARADGVPFGVGGILTFENLIPGADVGLKASYHLVTLELTGGVDFSRSNIAVEGLISTQRGFGPQGNLDFYGNLGVQALGGDGPDEVELSFGGGIIWPVGPGEIFAGIDFVDDAMFGGGFRFFF